MDKANFSPDLYQAIEKLKPHDHLCLIYENQEEQFNVAIPFIKMGLERHEKCIYIVDDNKFAAIKKTLRAQGIKVDDAIKSNQLSIIDKQNSYLKLGKFDPDWMIQFLKETTKAALDEGYAALRVTGEMTWALGGDPGNENLFEHESRLNKFFPKNACLAICQYNRKRFSPEIILNVIRTHPFVIFRGDIYTNYFFIPPDLFNTKNQPEQEVTQLLEGLQTLKRKETNLISSEQILIKKEEALEKEQFERKRAQEFLEANQKRYHILFESICSGVAVYEAVDDGSDFIFKDFNSAAERIERTPREKIIGRKVTEVFPGIREMTLLETFQRVWKTGKPENHPAAIYKDKHLVGWRENYVYKLPSGEIVAVYEDISERKKAELAIAESESKYKWLYINAPIPYHILSADGIIMDINRRWCEVLGYTRKEALGRDIFDFIVEEERDAAKLSFKNKKTSKKTYVEGSERNYRTKTGVIKTFKIYDHLVLDQNQNITSVQTTIEDITERKKAEEKFHHISTRDILTNLYNRTFYEEEMSRLEKSRLFPVSIFMIDLDDLKIVNDTQGHAAGDELLQRTAKVLLESFRAEDMVARIGGDEFVVLLPKTNEEAAQSAFKRIKHFLKLNNKNNPNVLIISIGVATCDKQGSLAKTVKQADDRMYLDKRVK